MLGKYVVCVVTSLLIHGCIILPSIYFFVTKKNPLPFIKGCTQALATAFGTDSSSATLPVSMMCCERNNHVSPLVSKFVLPLAATVNMNGTALYEALTVIFIAQLHGVSLGSGQLVVVALTSTLAAVGAAAIPSAGLVTMVMVLQSAVRNNTNGFTQRDTYKYKYKYKYTNKYKYACILKYPRALHAHKHTETDDGKQHRIKSKRDTVCWH